MRPHLFAMQQKTLITHIPVIHRGFLDFFKSREKDIAEIYLIDENLFSELTQLKQDIASLSTETAMKFLNALGFQNIFILSKENILTLKGKNLLLINDEVSRNLHERYFQSGNVEWASVFLRWDSASVVAEIPVEGVGVSKDPFDIAMMQEAYQEAKKSGDWWRQVGAVVVQNKKVVGRAYNQGVPSDHTPYQEGMVRDFFKAGEKQELSNTVHAESQLIAEAAKNGIGLKDASLYVTHFPCAVCAKTLAYSGIKNLYFREGASTLDGKKVLEFAGIKITFVSKL